MQYVFIFQALLEHYLYGDTELEVTSLETHLGKLYAPLPGAGCGGLEAEFKVGLSTWYFLPSKTILKCFTYFLSFWFWSFSLETHLHKNSEWQDENWEPASQHEEE